MIRAIFMLLAILGLAGCGGPHEGRSMTVNDDPALKPPVKIITPYGNTITCQAGPGAVCVQR